MHNHDDTDVSLVPQECPNCDDGCSAVRLCLGCDDVLCEACWSEHNEDAPCHVKEYHQV